MKLRYIIFTILIMIVILILGSSEVRADEYSTYFYNFNVNLGDELTFTKNQWYKSYNIFCIKAGAHTPTSLVIDGKMSSPNGKNFNWEGNKGTLTDEQIVKFIYIYSTLNDDIVNHITSREKNWESIQQQAIWSILGQKLAYTAEQWKSKHETEINDVLARAEAYYQFWLNNGGEVQTKIDTSEVELYNNKLGPFKLNFYQSTVNYNNITSTYGEIEEIKLVSSQNLGEPILCYSKSGGNILLSTTPTPDEELYINVEGIDITKYDSISVRFNDGYIRDAYIIKGNSKASDQQSSMYGTVARYAITKTEKFKLSEPLEITLKKTDMEGNSISGAVFGYAAYIDYNNTGYLTTLDDANDHGLLNMTPYFKVNGNDSNILEPSEFKKLGTGWRKVEPEAKIEIGNIGKLEYLYLIFNEDIAPEGYKQLEYPIAVKFKQENKEWKLEEIGKAVWSDTEVRYSFEANTEESVASFTDNVLTIKNKKYDELTFSIVKKGKDKSGNEINLSGVKFKITTQEKTFEATTDESGKIMIGVTYDGTLGMANGTTIKIEEISTAEGYEKLSTPISITLKKQGENWELKNIIGISDDLYSFEKSTDGNLGTLTIINEKIDDDDDDDDDDDGGGGNSTTGKDEINGYVYLDGYSGVKSASRYNGKMDGNEDGIQGVYVYLKLGDSVVSRDITDANGKYTLQVPKRDTTYTVEFKYDGVNYEATTTGAGSPVAENSTIRTSFNNKFKTIDKGKSNGVTSLQYFTKNGINNNPTYSGRTWILKTLNYTVGSNYHTVTNNYATTATTTFSMNNEIQYHYVTNNHTHSGCWYEEFKDDEGNVTGGQWHHFEYDTENTGYIWSDYSKLSTGHTDSCSNFTYYTNEKENYFLEAIVGNGGETRRWLNQETYKTSAQRDAYETKGGNSYQLNFGLLKREVDLSLVNDLKEVEVSINGQTTIYDYADIPIRGDTVNIGNINSNGRRSYLLELSPRDFLYGVRGTGLFVNASNVTETNEEFIASNAAGYDYDKLEIIATYRIALNNQSSTTATINSISYYYDKNYEFLSVNKGSASSENSATVAGTNYYRRNITELNIELEAGEQAFIEVTLKMKKTSNVITQKTYNTIAEITSYSAVDGKVDIDSAPDTAQSETISNFEDDTDMAPGLILRENNNTRTISGNLFFDERTETDWTNLNKYQYGNGIKNNSEDNVTDAYVQLIEIRDDGAQKKYYVWQEQYVYDGNYLFDNIVPGDYMVRFFYKSEHNGKTVRSTKDNFYEQYKNGKWYNEYYNEATRYEYSVARDNEARRLDGISQTVEIDKNLGKELADGSFYWMFADTSKIKLAVASETGTEISSGTRVDGTLRSYNQFREINFGIQEMPQTAIKLTKNITGLRITASDGTTIVDAETSLRDITGGEIIRFLEDNIRKGLTAIGASRDERGYWRLETDIEEVLAGATLEVIYTYSVENVGEVDYISTYLAEKFENLDAKGYWSDHDNNPATPDIYIEGYNDELNACAEAIRTVIGRDGYNSAIGTFLGSTYYTGVPTENVSIVKTHVGKIEDYINNDLKFTEVNSSDFTENKTESEHRNSGMSDEDIDKLPEEYKDKKEKYDAIVIDDSGTLKVDKNVKINSVVVSKYDIGKLLPNERRTQTIIVESNGKLSSTGVLDFPSNIAQIKTAYSNSMGRRDVYSIPGNLVYISISDEHESLRDGLDDTDINQFRDVAGNEIDGNIEPDSFWAETVEITKPTGEDKSQNIVLIISITAGIALVGIGTFAIKKYVL